MSAVNESSVPHAVAGGLCDAAEADVYRRALATTDLEARGYFVCDADLEDELIRALGTERVEQVIAAEGELASLAAPSRRPDHARTAPHQA